MLWVQLYQVYNYQMLFRKLFLYLLLIITFDSQAQLFINEILVLDSKIHSEPDYTKYTGWIEIYNAADQTIFLDGYYKAFAMGAGPCQLCTKCGKLCRHAEKARPSMEACGVDVYSTVRANGFPIEVLKTNSCAGNYYGVVLIE